MLVNLIHLHVNRALQLSELAHVLAQLLDALHLRINFVSGMGWLGRCLQQHAMVCGDLRRLHDRILRVESESELGAG